MRKIVEKTKHYIIYDINGMPSMYVSEDFVKKHYSKLGTKNYINSDIELVVKTKDLSNVKFDIFFDKDPDSNGMHRVSAISGDYGFNFPYINKKNQIGKKYRMQIFNQLKNMINIEFPDNKKENNLMESKIDNKKLRELIRKKVIEFITEKEVLNEIKNEEGKSKPTSGMKKEKVGTIHTKKTNYENPPSKKVTDISPENKTLTNAEPTEVESENKEKKIPSNTEFADRGKYTKEGSGYKAKVMGIELEVKGKSYADINNLYLLAQMKKALEGRGDFIKKVTIEMGEKEYNIEESKDIELLRNNIRHIIKEELKKRLNETGEMSKYDIEPGGEDYEWAKSIQDDIIKLQKMTKGKVKFLKMNPFDKYQGPYASVIINGKNDKIWSIENEIPNKVLYIENLEWTGDIYELAKAINGEENFIKKVKQNTNKYI